MEKGYIRPNHKFLWLILAFLFLAFGLTGCFGETRAPESFPTADIVYLSSGGVGFENADGSNATSIPFVVKDHRGNKSDWWRPVITGDNHTLIVKVIDYFFNVYGPAHLAVWRAGEYPVLCQNWQLQHMAYLNADQNNIFTNTDQGVAVYSLESCGTDKSPVEVVENIYGEKERIFVVPSPNFEYVAYTERGVTANEDRFIIVREILSGEVQEIGIGDYPAWSSDSQSLAFTGKDGIYIANVIENTKPRKVVLYPNLLDGRDHTYAERDYWELPPEVSWSPDGKWLVYHKWTGTDYDTGGDPWYNAIYKLNIETGEETKIIDHGMYPYWRWPIETDDK